MKLKDLSPAVALVLPLCLLPAGEAKAQTVISDEKLVTTIFVVNKTPTTVECEKAGCTTKVPMLKAIRVTCPAAMGKTCTFHILLETKVAVHLLGCDSECNGPGGKVFYQFLIDGVVPVPGPTDPAGTYVFADNVQTQTSGYESRQSFPASIVGVVKNSSSNHHEITVNLGCHDESNYAGCEAVAHWSTMRVDVFQP
jgi:hypothetical protein